MYRSIGMLVACVFCLGLPARAKTVQYFLGADDYGALSIDNVQVALFDGTAQGGDWTDVLDLAPGWHDIEIVFQNRWGSSSIAFGEGSQTAATYDFVPVNQMRSKNALGEWIDGLRADYYEPDGDHIATVYGEGPIHHVSGRWYEDMYNPDWASIQVPWGPSWWNLFTEKLSGQVYVAPAPLPGAVKRFCEYGSGVSVQLGSAGGLWQQTWGQGAWEWFDCDAEPDVGILSSNVVGLLQTWATGVPQVDYATMIAHLPLAGQLTLTAFGNKASPDGAGRIVGDFTGTFVVDGLASHALVDEEAGTIKILFGTAVEAGPDGYITVTETNGKFKSIQALGPWEWHVNGTLTLARIPNLPLQLNILAAFENSLLILGAEEEIVLAGSYTRSSPNK